MRANTMISSYTANDLTKISKDLVKNSNIFTIGCNLLWPTWLKQLENQAKRHRFS